ncbi:hypothetical protein LTR10_016741 [Elasticomyces elasticus]|uniref:Major facilitator superfamily (MFS) profile domain-containing protein n=1 Tax=Exophiala sideris TaxID=1016849 RepID=A0ABR0JMW2_9EURO|nr:hypothetical protein LTR10_016741 [Elasticomyces elasticus]KAK5037746.1 hypothetical protein LTS07_001213 [Exophiala sideris]KAK5043728.1 hypothetical protein LTR13_000082 [Exophiala sideris]KAK5067227.1 hypothetical protein LTR69_001214 [Exophiala sideris]KAK5182560.1 hypothetical protein LTR44_004951 [Eurotiomycetes sp. CCFEE 6388]
MDPNDIRREEDVADNEKYVGDKRETAHIDLTQSATAKIKNPLAHLTNEEVIRDVEEFANINGFAELTPILIKGALVAKDPPAFESVPGLTDVEQEAIRNEVLHKWRQPTKLYFTIILCSIGAAVQGWDQTGSNGANLSFPDALGIPVSDPLANGAPNPNAARNQWLQGLINAGPYIASAFLWVTL